MPFISVFDFDGNMPLNLSRNNLDGIIPFKQDLISAIYKDVLAKLLCFDYALPSDLSEYGRVYFQHPAIGLVQLICSNKGFILDDRYFLEKNREKTLIQFFPKSEFTGLIDFDLNASFFIISQEIDLSMSSFVREANIGIKEYGGKIYLKKPMYEKLFDNSKNRYPIGVRRSHKILNTTDDLIEISHNYSNITKHTLKDFIKNMKNCRCIVESKIVDYNEYGYRGKSIFPKEVFDKYLLDATIIPYDMDERKTKFKSAFEELQEYTKYYL